MTASTDAATLVRQGDTQLVFDTNVLSSHNSFYAICNAVNLLRAGTNPHCLNVVIPALAHTEMLHDLRQFLGAKFDPLKVLEGMKKKGANVAPYGITEAEQASAVLQNWFPTSDVWKQQKKEHCLAALGMAKTTAPGYGLASVDWFIASWSESLPKAVLITNDDGKEFEQVTRKLKSHTLRRLLCELLSERSIDLPKGLDPVTA